MSLACVYDKWRRKPISWVGSSGRDKSGWIRSLPLFSTGASKKGAMNAAGKAKRERAPQGSQEEHCWKQGSCPSGSLSKMGVI